MVCLSRKKIIEVINAKGHKNIQATHNTTFEITTEPTLGKYGDCIIAVSANKGAIDLCRAFKEAAKKKDAQITIVIKSGEEQDIIKAKGNPQLSFIHSKDLVIRKSNYVCSRTIAVDADKAARNISRRFVRKIQIPHQKIKIILIVQ